MTWTYLSSAPGSSGKSWVRMRIGDTSSGDQLLSDEEILALIDSEGNNHAAAAVAAESIGAQFARQADKQIGKLRISLAKASEHYFTLADRLRVELSEHSGGVYVGGVSEADKLLDEQDTDAVQPAFKRDQFGHYGDDSTGPPGWTS